MKHTMLKLQRSSEQHGEEEERIYRLAKHLWRGNFIHQIAARHLRRLPMTLEEIEQLLKAIETPSGFRWREQELAVALLGTVPLTEEQQKRCLSYFQTILETVQWGDYLALYLKRVVIMGVLTGLALAFANGDLYLTYTLQADSSAALWDVLGSCAAWCVPMLPVCSAWEDLHLNRLRAAVMRSCGSLQLLGVLTKVAGGVFDAAGLKQTLGCRLVRQAAEEALPSLLAALTPEHYGKLSSEAVPTLCNVLHHSDDALVLQVLGALEKVGDGRAVPILERMVKRGRTPELRREAERILPTLIERKRLEEASSVLLRASSAPAESADVLLRAAMPTAEREPTTLLRASAAVIQQPPTRQETEEATVTLRQGE